MESGEGIMLILVDQAGRYLFNAMTKKDFAIQWGPFLLSVLSAVKQENNKGKLVIVRRKEGQCIDITKPTLVKFLELRKALPRTQMKLKAVDAQRWMEQKSVQAVDDELNEALKVHGQKGDFIVSSVLVEDKLKSNVDWTPCLALMLRQNLIRSGRRQQRQNKP
jgi:hypothetical protein